MESFAQQLWSQLPQQLANTLINGGIFAMVAIGLTLVFGIMRVINFAHGTFYMYGAYLTFFGAALLGLPYVLSVAVAMVVIAIGGVVVEKLVFKPLREHPMIDTLLVSLGLLVFLEASARLVWTSIPRIIPSKASNVILSGLGAAFTLQRLITLLVCVLLISGLYLFIQKTRMGKAMRATAQNREAVVVVGIDVDRVVSVTFMIGSALAAAAGGLVGAIFTVYPEMGFTPGLKAFVVIVLGGMGHVPGAILGGLVLAFAETLGGIFWSEFKEAIGFVVLIGVLLLRPEGVLGKITR